MCSVHCQRTSDQSQLTQMEESHAGDVDDVSSQQQIAVNDDAKISDGLRRLDVSARHDYCIWRALQQTTRRTKTDKLSLRRVETESICRHPHLNPHYAVRHLRQESSRLCCVRMAATPGGPAGCPCTHAWKHRRPQ